MLEMPPRAPFPKRNDGKMSKREVAIVVGGVLGVVMVEIRRESIVVGGSTGELVKYPPHCEGTSV